MKYICLLLLISSNCYATPATIDSVPYNITQSGEYLFTHQILEPGVNAQITISASNVLLDLQGHTLEVSDSGEAILVNGFIAQHSAFTEPNTLFGPGGKSIFNVTIQNGTIINHSAGCVLFQFAANCTLKNVLLVSPAKCVFYDENGSGNHIVDCTFASGNQVLPPDGSHGPSFDTVALEGCFDLLENNRVGGSIASFNTGAANSIHGNVIRNNVLWTGQILSTPNDILSGNLIAP